MKTLDLLQNPCFNPQVKLIELLWCGSIKMCLILNLVSFKIPPTWHSKPQASLQLVMFCNCLCFRCENTSFSSFALILGFIAKFLSSAVSQRFIEFVVKSLLSSFLYLLPFHLHLSTFHNPFTIRKHEYWLSSCGYPPLFKIHAIRVSFLVYLNMKLSLCLQKTKIIFILSIALA